MWLQTFFLTLASPSTAMLSWLLPVIIFESKIFSKTGASLKQVKLTLDKSSSTQSLALGVCPDTPATISQ